MKGITDEKQRSVGSINVSLIFQHLSIEHKLHLVSDNFPIPCHGIIGKDFLRRHKCLIDYCDMKLTVRTPGLTPAQFDIQHEPLKGTAVVPARSETFKMFHIKADKFPCVVESREVDRNVFIPTTIVHEPRAWIRVLNVNIQPILIRTDGLNSQSIDNFDICVINGKSQSGYHESRDTQLTQVLNAKMPAHVKAKLIPLCLEFSDIFHLPNDKPTVNNFHRQKLSLKDNQPVFVKNYRLPQSQKEEIHQQVRKLLDDELIEMSTSNFNSPLIVVPKKKYGRQ